MKVFAYLLGVPAYIAVSLITMPVFFVTKFINAKLFNSIDSFYLGLIESLFLGSLFIFIMKFVFGWFNSPISILFVALVSIFVLSNNYHRFTTRPNKNLQLGYLVGEAAGMIGTFITLSNENIFF